MSRDRIRRKSMFLVSNSFFITAVLVIVQLMVWGGFYYLVTNEFASRFAMLFQILVLALTISMISYVVLRCPHNSYQIAWLILLALVPTLALIMYVILRVVPGTSHLTAQVYERKLATDLHLVDSEMARRDLAMMDNRYVGLFRYLSSACKYPTYYAPEVTYYSIGDEAIEAMFADLEKAEKFIFMEYFIVSEGEIIERLLDILERKVKHGV